MVEFSGGDMFKLWLQTRPEETRWGEAVALASRASASALPLLARSSYIEAFFAKVHIQTFRANILAWAVSKFRACRHKVLVADFSTSDFEFADAAAANTVLAAIARTDIAAITGCIAAASLEAGPRAAVIAYARVSHDASLLEAGDDVRSLLTLPLWPIAREDTAKDEAGARESWGRMRSQLLTRANEHWHVWIDWYQAMLDGKIWLPELDDKQREELAIQICLLPAEVWKEPAVVNKKITDLIESALDEARKGKLPDPSEMPQQTLGAPQFGPGPDGRIDLVPPGPEDRLSDTPAIRDLYDECRFKAHALAKFGAQILGEDFHAEMLRFLSKFPAEFGNAYERGVWSVGNSARGLLNAHDAVINDPDAIAHPAKLDRAAAEKLRDLVQTFNNLAFDDPKLRKRDSRRPGPTEAEDNRNEVALAKSVVLTAANDETLTTPAASEEIIEQHRLAQKAGDDLPGKLQVEQTRDAYRNFVAPILSWARDAGKEIKNGIYNGIGVMALDYARVNGWQALVFVKENAQALLTYCGHAFPDAPGASQIVHWILQLPLW